MPVKEAELIVLCRLTDLRSLYDHVDWANKYDISALYEEVERAEQLNDDRIARTLDLHKEHRADHPRFDVSDRIGAGNVSIYG